MSINGLSYKGVWNISINTLTSTPLSGDYFKILVTGTTNIESIDNLGD
jgi:hypothetical protein